MTHLAKEPLYAVQLAAVEGSEPALVELGRRYALAVTLSFKSEQHRTQVGMQYIRGWNGQENPYLWRGGNFAAPYRRAYDAGKREHAELAQQVAAYRQAGAR